MKITFFLNNIQKINKNYLKLKINKFNENVEKIILFYFYYFILAQRSQIN